MRQTRDSFLHLLKDNLPINTPLHNLRRDTSKPDSDKLHVNAVNVQFLDAAPNAQVGSTLVEIAVIHEDELTALAWVKDVYDILGARYMTEKFDYTVPATPVATGTNLYWERDLQFKAIYSEHYVDFRCALVLRHKVDS